MSLEPSDIDEMTSHNTPQLQDILDALKQNLSPKDTTLLPENSLYHGLNVWGKQPPQRILPAVAQEGMRGGWFSEEPQPGFGPHYLTTRPEDLPPLLVRERQFSQDPEKEVIPRWNNFPTTSLEARMKLKGHDPAETLVPETVKGRPAKRSLWANIHQLVGADEEGGGVPFKGQGGAVVPPEKLFLTNPAGETVGRLAPKGGKPNAVNAIWDRVKAFRNVLEEGTGKAKAKLL